MQQLREALLLTTSHGLPRLVTKKPIYIKVIWFLLFLAALGLCLQGTAGFVKKLQSQQVTTTLEANALDFKFPDIYACFENPVSSSYAASLDVATISKLQDGLAAAESILRTAFAKNSSNITLPEVIQDKIDRNSFAMLHSLPYTLLVNSVSHRLEQAVITSDVTFINSNGLPAYVPVTPTSFYHPVFMRCIRWALNSSLTANLTKSGTSSGLVTTLLTDANYSSATKIGPAELAKVSISGTIIPVSDWSLARIDYDDPDRKAGVRIFLCPPGEYPTQFVTSFSLGPGRFHTVEMSMTEQVYNPASFSDCVKDPPSVQFTDPYTNDPMDFAYSYSYCYYYEYHRQYQAITNLSGDASPLPWPLKGRKYLFNLTGSPENFLPLTEDLPTPSNIDLDALSRIVENTQQNCKLKSPCTKQLYDVTISNTDWPTYSSVRTFIKGTISSAMDKVGNLSVPALEELTSLRDTDASNFINANLLKVNFRIRTATCSRMTFSIDYGAQNFISDLGGIMGIYLGMSLLTLVELLEFGYDMVIVALEKRRNVRPDASDADLAENSSACNREEVIMVKSAPTVSQIIISR